MNWVIYILKNPRSQTVRYVGWTSKSADERLREHIQTARRSDAKTHNSRWILSLLAIGLYPVAETIESGSGDGWREAERRWIAFYRAEGTRLTNLTDGGDGCFGRISTQTKEQRVAIARHAGLSQTTDQRSVAAKKGNLSRWAATAPDQRDATMKLVRASLTTEKRSNNAKQWQAAKTSQERSEAIRKGNANRTAEQMSAAGKKARAAGLAKRTS